LFDRNADETRQLWKAYLWQLLNNVFLKGFLPRKKELPSLNAGITYDIRVISNTSLGTLLISVISTRSNTIRYPNSEV